MDTEKDRSLQLLRGAGHQIVKLEERIVSLIGQAENMRAQKGRLEYRLEKLGVSVEKLEEVAKLKDPEYCRTSERVKVNEANERKRKREEDEKEKEEKKRKVISVREGDDVVISIPDENVNENKEKEFQEKCFLQQKSLIQEQELMIKQQNLELQKLNVQLQSMQQQQQQQQLQELPQQLPQQQLPQCRRSP